jgi:hypothetical protein
MRQISYLQELNRLGRVTNTGIPRGKNPHSEDHRYLVRYVSFNCCLCRSIPGLIFRYELRF